jgi:ParB family chromosome partitioning protein
MSQAPKPRGLGRGLSALLGDEEVAATVAPVPAPAPAPPPSSEPSPRPAASRAQLTLPTAFLRPGGASQPRTVFDGLDPLVDSVRQHGLLQPILVRPVSGEPNAYEIVAGERRWRAAQKAQLHEVPVVVRNLDMLESLQLALIENLQRTDLSPWARAVRTLPTCCVCSICPNRCANWSRTAGCRQDRRARCSLSPIRLAWHSGPWPRS